MTAQAIQTRYLGPTNTRGARIKAFSEAFPRGVTIPYPHELNSEWAHDKACVAFARAHEWFGTWARGGSVDGRGNVYVLVKSHHATGYRTPHPQAANPLDLVYVLPDSEIPEAES